MSAINQIEMEKTAEADIAKTSTGALTQVPSSPANPQASPDSNDPNSMTAKQDTADVELAAPPLGPLHSVFTARQKRFICFMAAMGSAFSPISSFIYLPALNTLSHVLHVSTGNINLTVTSYQIFQGLAPMFFGDLADMAGRRPVYIICFTIYLAANLGLALQDSFAALFILRAIQSSGSSGTIALGNGVVADIVTAAERGAYIGYVQAGINIGPALGPVIGGILSKFLGWRSIFWFLVITAGTYLVAYIFLAPETGRNVVGNGSIPPQGWNMSLMNYLQKRKEAQNDDALTRTASREQHRLAQVELAKRRKLRFPNPLHAMRIVVEKDVALVLFFGSFMVTVIYCVMVTIPSAFKKIYGFNDLQIGLCYIPFSSGSVIGSIIGGKLLDWNFRRIARNVGVAVDYKRGNDLRNFPIEKARLQVITVPTTIGLLVIIGFGWVIEAQTSLAGPLIIMFFAGGCMNGSFSMVGALLVDLYPQSPSTAMAAYNLARCLMSAGGTAVVQYVVEAMGAGWCFTFLGLTGLCFQPLLLAVMTWGPKWREERFLRVQKKKNEKEEKKRLEREAQGELDDFETPVTPTGVREKKKVEAKVNPETTKKDADQEAAS